MLFSVLQESLNRCVMSCQDDIKDKVTPDTPDSKVTEYREEFERCAIACCQKNVSRIPGLTTKVKDALKSKNFV